MKFNSTILQALTTLLFTFISVVSFAQSGISLYHLGDKTIQINQYNPAHQAAGGGNLALPFISKQSVGLKNTFSFNDIFQKQLDGTYQLVNNELYQKAGYKGNLTLELDKMTIFQTGFKIPSAGLGFTVFSNLTSTNQLYYSKDLFRLILGGTAESIGETLQIEGVQLSSVTYADMGVGVQKAFLDNKLKVGANVKYLMGLGYLKSHDDLRIGMTTNADTYAMTFDLKNVSYMHALPLDLQGKSLTDQEEYTADFDPFRNKGFAIDLGASYTLLDKFEFSAAATDIGTILWKDVQEESVQDKTFTFSGAELNEDGGNFSFKDSLDAHFKTQVREAGSLRTRIPARALISASYKLTAKDIFTHTYTSTFYPKQANWAYGFGYTRKFGEVLTVSLNAIKQHQQPIGLGVGTALQLGPLQVYAASDNLMNGLKVGDARGADVRVGLNLIFGRKVKVALDQMAAPGAAASEVTP